MRAIVRLFILSACLACVETPCDRIEIPEGYRIVDAAAD